MEGLHLKKISNTKTIKDRLTNNYCKSFLNKKSNSQNYYTSDKMKEGFKKLTQ